MKIFDSKFRQELAALRLRFRKRLSQQSGGGQTNLGIGGRNEFRDFRPYLDGDDFRDIDWALFGRLGQLYVKRFQAEHQMQVVLLLDRSASMGLNQEKDRAARQLVGALAYALVDEGVSIQVVTFAAQKHPLPLLIRNLSACEQLFLALEDLGPARGVAEPKLIAEFLARSPGSRCVVTISDFLGESFLRADAKLSSSQQIFRLDLCLLSQQERQPPATGGFMAKDIESDKQLAVALTPQLVQDYHDALGQHIEQLRARIQSSHGAFVELQAEASLTENFERILATKGVIQR